MRGAVRLRVERCGDELHFRVVDTGPGLAPELHEVVFEKFRQGDARVSHEHGGTGLGLALSRALAELMHGRLALASRLGEGSTFTLSLPVQTAGGDGDPVDDDASASTGPCARVVLSLGRASGRR